MSDLHAQLTVAVTGMNARPDNPGPGLAVARALRDSERFQGRIIGMGYDALDPGLYLTGQCDAGYLLPYPSAGEDALIERLKTIHASDPIDILVPCLDAELMSLVRLKPILDEMGISTLLPSRDQLRMCNKDRLGELAAIAEVKCPESRNITDVRFFDTCTNEGWRYPMVVKGLFYDAKIVRNRHEAQKAFSSIAGSWGLPVVVQRFLDGGEEVNLSALGDGKGNLIAPVMMTKRAITDKGKAWSGMTIHDQRLLSIAEKIVKRVHWPGPLEVEVMRTPDGQYHLIEINPRFPAWIYLSHGVGRNLPATLVDLITETPLAPFPDPKPGVLFIRYALEQFVSLKQFESMVMHGNWSPQERSH